MRALCVSLAAPHLIGPDANKVLKAFNAGMMTRGGRGEEGVRGGRQRCWGEGRRTEEDVTIRSKEEEEVRRRKVGVTEEKAVRCEG